MDELLRILKELNGKLPEVQRLVDEANEYPIHPPEVREAANILTEFARAFNDNLSELRHLLLSNIEGELPPSDDPPEWPPEGPGTGQGPLFPPSPDPEGGAGMGARRTPPPLPRSPGGERLPEEAREMARNP